MKPADVCVAVTVAVIRGLAFIARRIALDEFSPPLTTERFGPLRLSGMVTVILGIAVMLLAKPPRAASKPVLPKIA